MSLKTHKLVTELDASLHLHFGQKGELVPVYGRRSCKRQKSAEAVCLVMVREPAIHAGEGVLQPDQKLWTVSEFRLRAFQALARIPVRPRRLAPSRLRQPLAVLSCCSAKLVTSRYQPGSQPSGLALQIRCVPSDRLAPIQLNCIELHCTQSSSTSSDCSLQSDCSWTSCNVHVH